MDNSPFQTEISRLHTLERMIERVKILEESVQYYKDQHSALTEKIRKSSNSVSKRPTNNHDELKKTIDMRIHNEANGKKGKLQTSVIAAIVLLGIACALILFFAKYMTIDTKVIQVLSSSEMRLVALFFTAVLTASLAIYSSIEKCTPFDDFGDWISIGGFFFFAFCIFAPIEAVAICAACLFLVAPVFAVIPVAMVVLMIIGRVVRKHNFKEREYSARERKALEEAKRTDQANRAANYIAQAQIYDRNMEQNRAQLNKLDQSRSQAEAEIRTLQREIKQNGLLSEEDLPYVDRLVWFLESGRADSLKEALQLLDVEKRERNRIASEQFYRRSREIEDRWNRDMAEQQHASDRAAAQHHREKLEEKLDEIEEDIKYYNKYGWDKA